MGGANQQERLLTHEEQKRWFLAGLFEGEGSLCVSIKEHPTARFGYLIDPEVFMYQHESRRQLLELAQEVFGTGRIFRKTGNYPVLVYAIHSRRSISERVVPFLEKYVMPFSARKNDIALFIEIVRAFERKEHHTREGILRILDLAYQMNPEGKGKRRKNTKEYVVRRIPRDCTPDTRESEETVRPA
jgi:hypothetical protein